MYILCLQADWTRAKNDIHWCLFIICSTVSLFILPPDVPKAWDV